MSLLVTPNTVCANGCEMGTFLVLASYSETVSLSVGLSVGVSFFGSVSVAAGRVRC
jgi:hypothetical protein